MNTDNMITAIEARPSVEERVRALVEQLKFAFAEALQGAVLPPDAKHRMADIFPSLETDVPRFARAIEHGRQNKAPAIDASLPANEAGAKSPVTTDNAADRFSQPASDAMAMQGQAATETANAPVKSGEAQLKTDADK